MRGLARPSANIGTLLLIALAADAAPLPTRDQNPFLAATGIPVTVSARNPEGSWAFAADLNWGSTALLQSASDELLIVDAETRELRVSIERRVADRWSVGLQLPYRDMSGGSLDGFIDNWHEWFGLPEGARPLQPQDRLLVRYASDTSMIDERHSQRGIADATLFVGYELLASATSAARTVVTIDLPTGEDHWFLTNDAVEISAILAAEHRFSQHWSLSAQGAVTWLDQGNLLPHQQRDLVWSGHTGLAWQATHSIELALQLDAHTRVFDDSELDFFSDALVLTVGGRYAITPEWMLSIGVSEDISVEQSPDVVFVIGVSRGRSR